MHIEISSGPKYWIVVEGPSPGDARFVSQWLQEALAADAMLASIFANEPNFRETISRLEIISCVEFGPAAMAFITMWLKDLTAFAMDVLGSEWGEMFSIMSELGFFTLTGDRYQITVPRGLTPDSIKLALGRLAETEDSDFVLHQELIVHTISFEAAQQWGNRLDKLPWQQRLADRDILLENNDLLDRYT